MKMILVFATMIFGFSAFAENEEFKVCVHEFAPFAVVEKGQPVGPFADIAKEACKRAKLDCKFSHLPNKRAKKAMAENEVDIIFPMGWNKARTEKMFYSPKVVQTSYALFHNTTDDFKPQKLEDFAGKKIGVFAPSNLQKNLQKMNDSLEKDGHKAVQQQKFVVGDGRDLKVLNAGRVDAVMNNRDLGNFHIKNQQLRNVAFAYAYKKLHYYATISKTNPNKGLFDRWTKALDSMTADGTHKKILERYDMMMPEDGFN